jgi:acetyltransferase-like isoleucine patch superfamily enzyme
MGDTGHRSWSPRLALRFGWTVVSLFVVESVVLGVAALPTVAFLSWHASWGLSPRWLKVMIVAMAVVPSYLIFAAVLMAASAWSVRLLGWRPPAEGELSIADLDPRLCDWGRYMISAHVVKTLVGPFLQATPAWNWYLRMNGARIGRRAWINSLGVTDHCNLDIGDEVVIGAGVHLSAHTVERGVVRIAPVRIGAGSTIGVNTHVQIGADIGERVQVGSLSLVPKHACLDGPATWAGVPVRRLDRGDPSGGSGR